MLTAVPSKHLWTACSAVLLPNCFISRASVMDPAAARITFTRYYTCNAVMFLLVVAGTGLAATNCILLLAPDQLTFSCDNLPFLSYDAASDCPPGSPLAAPPPGLLPHSTPHSWFHLAGSPAVLLLGLLQPGLVWAGEAWLARRWRVLPRV